MQRIVWRGCPGHEVTAWVDDEYVVRSIAADCDLRAERAAARLGGEPSRCYQVAEGLKKRLCGAWGDWGSIVVGVEIAERVFRRGDELRDARRAALDERRRFVYPEGHPLARYGWAAAHLASYLIGVKLVAWMGVEDGGLRGRGFAGIALMTDDLTGKTLLVYGADANRWWRVPVGLDVYSLGRVGDFGSVCEWCGSQRRGRRCTSGNHGVEIQRKLTEACAVLNTLRKRHVYIPVLRAEMGGHGRGYGIRYDT
jgi:hypothetical protein